MCGLAEGEKKREAVVVVLVGQGQGGVGCAHKQTYSGLVSKGHLCPGSLRHTLRCRQSQSLAMPLVTPWTSEILFTKDRHRETYMKIHPTCNLQKYKPTSHLHPNDSSEVRKGTKG